MKYQIYTIKDVLSGSMTDLLLFANDEMAIRYFNGLCQESKIKDDLQLFKLGEYETETGNITSSVKFIKGGVDYAKE